MTTAVASLLLTDRAGLQTRFWPIYRLVLAWSVREGDLKVWGPMCLN